MDPRDGLGVLVNRKLHAPARNQNPLI